MSSSWFGTLPWYLLLPFLVAVAIAGLVRLVGGPGRGAVLAGIAIPGGFVAGWLLLRGAPTLPPVGALAQVPYVALAGILLGVTAVTAGLRRGGLLSLTVLFASLATWAAFGFRFAWSWPLALQAAGLLAAWLIVLPRLESRSVKEPLAAIMTIMLACGIGAVALTSGEGGWARLAFALAAASAGFAAWNWAAGFPFLMPALLGGAGAAVALAGSAALSGALPWPALVVLLLIPFADGTAAQLPSGSGLIRRLLQPIMLALTCLLPLALAVLVAYVMLHIRSR